VLQLKLDIALRLALDYTNESFSVDALAYMSELKLASTSTVAPMLELALGYSSFSIDISPY